MDANTSIPDRVCIALLDAHKWLPQAMIPDHSPLFFVDSAINSTLNGAGGMMSLAPVTYRKMRDILDTRQNKLVRLFVILLLHFANDPNDLEAHQATQSLYKHLSADASRQALSLLRQSDVLDREWIPATGPPCPGAARIKLWGLPSAINSELAFVKAGCGSLARESPYSGDRTADEAVTILGTLLSAIWRTPPSTSGAARFAFQVWISYADLLLRALKSPLALDEERCILILHCLANAGAMLRGEDMFQLGPELRIVGVRLLKRDLRAVLDAIALHPEWATFPSTSNLAVEVGKWLKTPGAICRPPKAEGTMARYPQASGTELRRRL